MAVKILSYQLTDGRTLIIEDDCFKVKEKFGFSSIVKKNEDVYSYSDIKSLAFRLAEEEELIQKAVAFMTLEISGQPHTFSFQLTRIENLTYDRENSRLAYLYLLDKTK